MKFSSLQHTGVKTMKVPKFNGGLNLTDLPTNISDNQLTQCNNMVFNGGFLKTREGLSAEKENIICKNAPDDYCEASLDITSNEIYIDGAKVKIAVSDILYDDSYHLCQFYFIDSSGNSTYAGKLDFFRTENTIFYEPCNFTFYTGSAVNGGGVFLFVTKKDRYSPENKWYEIYEISEDMTSWDAVRNYYTPVVYINGRGTRYEEAKSLFKAFTGKPTMLESPNLLNGRFIAYFSSDFHSSCFRLPYADLADEYVKCRLYSAPDSYTEWFVGPTQKSNTQKLYTADITFNVDRKKGIVYFTSADGTDYPLPTTSTYQENNLQIHAGKNIPNGFQNVVSSTCTAICKGKTVFSGGIDKGAVYSISADNPLYFPQQSTTVVGNNNKQVEALLTFSDNTILALKENEAYTLTLKAGKAINSNSLLADNDKIFYENDAISSALISEEIGCVNKHTIALCFGNPVWVGKDKNIYALNAKNHNISLVSNTIAPIISTVTNEELSKAFAVYHKNTYMLFAGSKGFVMDFSLKDITSNTTKWYSWDFGKINILEGIENNGKLSLLCLGSDEKVLYSASLSGNNDADITYGEPCTIAKEKIHSSVSTKHFNIDNISQLKLIESIFLSLSSRGKIDIYINKKRFDSIKLNSSNADCGCNTLNSVRIIPSSKPLQSFCISLASTDGLSLGELILYYRNSVK